MNATEKTWTICLYDSTTDNEPKRLELTKEELVVLLTEHERTDCHPCRRKHCKAKDGQAWSPVVIQAGKKRANKNVESVTLAMFDIDGITWDQLDQICERVEGHEVILHSSHSYAPPNDCRVRLVFFLSRSLAANEYRPFWDEVNQRFRLGADPIARPISQLFFLPSAPSGNPVLGVYEEGKVLDVDEILRDVRREALRDLGAPSIAPTTSTTPPLSLEEVDMGGLRDALRQYRPNENDPDGEWKKTLVRRVLSEEALADEGERDIAVHKIAWVLAAILPLETPQEAVLELLRPALVSLPGPPPDKFPSWLEKAADSHARAVEAISKDRAGREEQRKTTLGKLRTRMGWSEPSTTKEVTTARTETTGPRPSAQTETSSDTKEPEEEDPEAWKDLLQTSLTKTGTTQTDPVPLNVGIILECSPAWKNVLRLNEVTKDIEVVGGPLTEAERTSDHLGVAISNWLQAHYRLNLNFNVVKSELCWVATRNKYDPVKEYLHGTKQKWDGVPRVDRFLEVYFGARVEEDGRDISHYVRNVSRRWLLGAAARGLFPGCKMDNVLILEGDQGKKKSTALDVLGGEWFAEQQIQLTSKDSRELASKTWIAELSELASARQAEAESLKGFFSQRIDHFRLSYGERVQPFPRRSVFVGSTNDETYLKDPTGNRRYWPVFCEAFNIRQLRKDRDQIWAEAALLVLEANECKRCELPDRCDTHRWWFSDLENEELESINNNRLNGSNDAELILKWWLKMDKETRKKKFNEVKFTDFAVGALDIPKYQTGSFRYSIGCAVKKLGFVKKRSSSPGRPWVYVPTDTLLTMETVKDGLTSYSGGKKDNDDVEVKA